MPLFFPFLPPLQPDVGGWWGSVNTALSSRLGARAELIHQVLGATAERRLLADGCHSHSTRCHTAGLVLWLSESFSSLLRGKPEGAGGPAGTCGYLSYTSCRGRREGRAPSMLTLE